MKTEDYLYKSKELPYWGEEVIEIVKQILTGHDKEIISKIDEMILNIRQTSNDFSSIYALTELKERIK